MLKKVLKSVLDLLDHKDINDLEDFKGISPSSEILSKYIYEKMKEQIPLISKISIWETSTSCASYFE